MAWEQIGSSYDTVAGKYEARFLDELREKPRDRELLTMFASTAGDPIVEIGCGPGQIGAFVRELDDTVFGVDLSSEMARLASSRLDAALVADMRSLPFVSGGVGGLLAFYSLIHLRRAALGPVLREFHRVLRPGGRLLLSAHEGSGEIELDEFLGERVPFGATFFELDELVGASRAAGLVVAVSERRESYASESGTVRLYVEATKPGTARADG